MFAARHFLKKPGGVTAYDYVGWFLFVPSVAIADDVFTTSAYVISGS